MARSVGAQCRPRPARDQVHAGGRACDALETVRTRIFSFALCVLASSAWACTSNSTLDADASSDAADPGDIVNDLVVDAPPPPPPWPHDLTPAAMFGNARGLVPARVIIHAHSVHSHDACDGNPYVDGGPNEPCLQDFRLGVCRTRIDIVFLTEHATLMGDGSFERVLQVRPGDERIEIGGRLVGYWIACANGHRTMILPGAENAVMPIALTRHPDPIGGDQRRAYTEDTAAASAAFHAAGALVAIPHVEQRTVAHMLELQPELMEVYNIHSNLDPRIAEPFLGFNPGEFFLDLSRFTTDRNLEADWVAIAFFRENQNDLDKWAQMALMGRRILGFAGSDAHQNAIQGLCNDGERGDSYRRIFRFFSNMLLLDGPITRERALDAIRARRGHVVFDAWGTPAGYDFIVRTTTGGTSTDGDVGATVRLTDTPLLRMLRPSVAGLNPALPTPTVRMRILRAEGMSWTEVAAGNDATLEYRVTTAGIYRGEVRINPLHAAPYIRRLERVIHEVPWIYSNPVYVDP